MGKKPIPREEDKPIFNVSEMVEWKDRALTAERKIVDAIKVMEWVDSIYGVVIPQGDAAQGIAEFRTVLHSLKEPIK